MSVQPGRATRRKASRLAKLSKFGSLFNRSALVEHLEQRVLFSTDYLLNGNQLTTTVNGVQGTPQTVPNVNNVQLTGDPGVNHFTIENFSGNVTVDGQGGGDVVTVYAGGGGTVTVHDSAPTPGNPDTMIVYAPTVPQVSVTVAASQITAGADTINYDNTVGAVSLIGQPLGDDALTINGSSSAEAVTIGASSVTVGGAPGLNYSTFNSLTVNGGGGNDSFSITNTNVGTATTVNGGTGNDNFLILNDAGPTSLDTGGGSDQVSIAAIGAATTITSAGHCGIVVSSAAADGTLAGIAAPLIVAGAGNDTLTLDDSGDTNNSAGALGLTTVTGLGMRQAGVTYAGLAVLNVFLGSQANTFAVSNTASETATNITGGASSSTITIAADAGPTNVNTGDGTDVVDVQNTSAATTLTMGTGTDTVNVGSNAPLGNSIDEGIQGTLMVVGGGSTSLNVDDSGDAGAKTIALTATNITGASPAAIDYDGGVDALGLMLGSGNDTLTVASTNANATTDINTGPGNDAVGVQATAGPTNITTGGGSNSVVVSSNAPAAGGMLENINGPVVITGGGSDSVTMTDSADAYPRVATLNPGSLIGLSPSPISFAGMSSVTVNLDNFNNALTVSNTVTGTTTVNSGTGSNTIDLQADAGPTTINTGTGSDTVNVQSTSAATTIAAGVTGTDIFNIGSNAPAGSGVLDTIAGAIAVTGDGSATLNIDDTGSTSAQTGTLSSTALTGLGSAGITYGGLSALNIGLGSGNDSLTVASTATGTPTTIDTGPGNNTVNILADASTTTVNNGGGSNTVNVGSTAPSAPLNPGGVLNDIADPLRINGGGHDTLNLDDGGSSASKTGTLSPTTLQGLSPATITYDGLAALNLVLGSGADTFTVSNTAAGTATTINTGAGTDRVNVQHTSAATTVTTATGGTSTIDIGSNAPAGHGLLAGITGAVTVRGSGSDTLKLDDTADTAPVAGTVSATTIAGIAPAAIAYSGLAALNISLGDAGNTLSISYTAAGTATVINSGSGADQINIRGTNSPTTINAGAGVNNVNVGSLAPAAGGTVSAVVGPLAVNGSGVASLQVDDTGAATPRTGLLTATSLVLGPADITYSGITRFDVSLGSGDDDLDIVNTAAGASTTVAAGTGDDTLTLQNDAGPTTIDTGAGNDTVNVRAISATTSVDHGGVTGVDTFNVGSVAPAGGGVLDQLLVTLGITGGGGDALNVDDSGSVSAETGSLSPTAIGGLGSAGINYSGLARLAIGLGSGGTTFAVSNTHAGTSSTLNVGAGNNTIDLTDDSSNTTINTKGGTNAIAIQGTHAATAVNNSAATDTIAAGSLAPQTGGVLDNLYGPLSVTGGVPSGPTALSLDDSASVAAKSVVVTAGTVSGLSPAAITYGSLSSLAIGLGSGGDTVDIQSTAAGTATTITSGAGHDSFSVAPAVRTPGGSPAALAGPLSIDGGDGVNTLLVDDSSDTASRSVALTPASITGLGGPVNYANFSSLDLALGSGGGSLAIDEIDPAAATTITTAGTSKSAPVQLSANFAGDFTGNLSVQGTSGGSINIGGNLSGSLAVLGNLDSVSVGQGLTGSLPISGTVGTLSIGGDLAGGVSAGGDLDSATIGSSLTGSLAVAGKLSSLTIGGAEPGSLEAGAVGTIAVAAGIPDAAGDVFSVTLAGVTRSISVSPADNSTPLPSLAGLSFGVLYDASLGVPQAAVRVSGGSAAGARLDLLLSAPPSAAFNLSRLDTATGAAAGTEIRNVSIDGSVLGSVTPAEQAYFGYPEVVSAKPPKKGHKPSVKSAITPPPGGIQLPADDLAVVSARSNIRAGSINAAGIEGLAFATLTDASGVSHSANATVSTSRGFGASLVLSALATNATTHKPLTQVLRATDPLQVAVNPGKPIALFEGTIAGGFNPHGLLLSDSAAGASTVTITATYVQGTPPGKPQVATLSFSGNGGSIDTYLPVQNITSTGTLGDVLLRAGKSELLQSLDATSVTGTLNLFGGTIASTNVPGVQAGKPPKVGKHHARKAA
jgi:hypothetical protein